MAYNSRSPEYAADKAELIALYDAAGFDAASARCAELAAARNLAAHERLTLADGVRRALILRGGR